MKLYAADTGGDCEITPESKVADMIPLTVMNDVRGSARSGNGENAGITEASGVRGVVLDLEAVIGIISAHICQTTRRMIHLGAAERGA